MSSKTQDQKIDELLDRSIRTESRLVQLGDHVGANLRVKQRIDITKETDGETTVHIDSMDVSLSRILAELRSAGISGVVTVRHDDVMVATIYAP